MVEEMSKTTRYAAIALIVIGIVGLVYIYIEGNQELTLEKALRISEEYLESSMPSDLEIDEIMEFEYNYYVVYVEESTGIGAMEMLIDKESGRIFPEYGPNMMWNTKYGHGGMMSSPGGMMGGFTPSYSDMVFNEDETLEIAQRFLDEVYPGSQADDPHPFYGYYTIHTTRDGEIFGMLSVNTYTGQVWYHNWHGKYIQSMESH
jgi:hypothetical protein